MKPQKGFTLAEVLITLAVIGVVAAMTIPALIGSTNQAELTTSFKKAVAALNQSVIMSIAQDNYDVSTFASPANTSQLTNFFKNKLNVIRSGEDYFYTADGMKFTFVKRQDNVACGTTDQTGNFSTTVADCYVLVDVNGDKSPNQLSSGNGSNVQFRDQYNLVIMSKSVIPASNATDTAATSAIGR